MKLDIITPSYINSDQRYKFASDSLKNISEVLGEKYTHIIVDDKPYGTGRFSKFFPNKKFGDAGKNIYSKKNNIYIRPEKKMGSTKATYLALEKAKNEGADLVFLHLDDHYYTAHFDKLVKFALDAFENDNTLQWVRFSGHPIINDVYDEKKGNLSLIEVVDDTVHFENIELKPNREKDYTLWWADLKKENVEKDYWPVALWFCIYRVKFLEDLLQFDEVMKLDRLADVEVYYKNIKNWQKFLVNHSGKFGYINMQVGGTEMQRNSWWRNFDNLPNNEIR